MPNADLITASFPLSAPLELRPAGGGVNNLTQVVDAPEGRFFLRVYQNTAEPDRVRFEHAVLTRLAAQDLPFAVPAPMLARSGETLVSLPDGALAALFPLIPGDGAQGLNLRHARAAGEALAWLHRGLARVGRVEVGRPTHGYGDLYHVHPLVPDPVEGVRSPGVEPARLTALVERLIPQVERLYAELPQQIIHADYARSNLLLVDDRVTGVLDFEFACYDLRATDICTGLYPFALGHHQTGQHWALLDAFLEGYTAVQPLTRAEVEAIPTLLLLVRTVSLLHWTGRMRQGLCAPAEIQERAVGLLAYHDWLETNRAELLARFRRI